MTKPKPKLALQSETLVHLSHARLERIAGGLAATGGIAATDDCFIMKDTSIVRTGIVSRP